MEAREGMMRRGLTWWGPVGLVGLLLVSPGCDSETEDTDEELDCTSGYEQGTAINGRAYDPHYDFTGEFYVKGTKHPQYGFFVENECSATNPCPDQWECSEGFCSRNCTENADCEEVLGFEQRPWECIGGQCTGFKHFNWCTATLVSLDNDYPATRVGAVLTAGHGMHYLPSGEDSGETILVGYDTCTQGGEHQRCDGDSECNACGADYSCMGAEPERAGWCKRRVTYQGVQGNGNIAYSELPETGLDLGLSLVEIPLEAPLPDTLLEALASLPRPGRVVMQPATLAEGASQGAVTFGHYDDQGEFHDHTARRKFAASNPAPVNNWLALELGPLAIVSTGDSGSPIYNTGPPDDIRTIVGILRESHGRHGLLGSWLCEADPLPANLSWLRENLEALNCSTEYWGDMPCEMPEYYEPDPGCPTDTATE
jgi:hypothetical protein